MDEGSHEELMKKSVKYQELVRRQLSAADSTNTVDPATAAISAGGNGVGSGAGGFAGGQDLATGGKGG